MAGHASRGAQGQGVNGSAVLSVAPADIALCSDERRAPKRVIKLTVQAPAPRTPHPAA